MVFRRASSTVPMHQLRDEMDRLVSGFFAPGNERPTPRWAANRAVAGFPPFNVWEEGDVLYAEAEIPGVKAEDFEVSVLGSDLTVTGRRATQHPADAIVHRQERGQGEFNRVLRLPYDVDSSQVEATISDGVLLIKLPKAESAKPRKINVTAGN